MPKVEAFFNNLVFFIFHMQEKMTIAITITIQKKITFTGTITYTLRTQSLQFKKKKERGGATLSKFSFTECLARFFSISHSA